jgi:hypothetical protein
VDSSPEAGTCLANTSPISEVPITGYRETTMSSQFKTYYHITKPENLESIQREGLKVQCGANCQALGETKPGVYLLETLEDVDTAFGMPWVEQITHEDEDSLVLRVQVDPAQVEVEEWDRRCLVDISPEHIQVERIEPAADTTGLGMSCPL